MTKLYLVLEFSLRIDINNLKTSIQRTLFENTVAARFSVRVNEANLCLNPKYS